jgi:3-dehydroquinate dehydratase
MILAMRKLLFAHAVGQRVPAPGQIPIEALRSAMAALGSGV